jgi:membrane-bound acyltransferase YfiQ involved in biofilm formation
MKKNLRLQYVDSIRMIGMFSIILIHVTSIFLPNNSTAYILNQFSRFGVPIFFILSGISLYYNYPVISRNNFFKYYKKRFITIVIPYLLWILIYFVYEYRHNISGLFNIKTIIEISKSIFIGKRHLYFLIIMIQFYIIYPFFCKIISMDRYDNLIIILSFLITLYLNLAAYLMRWHINITPFLNLDYLYLMMPSWLFYFIMGVYFIKNQEKIISFINKNETKSAMLCAWVISFLILLADGKLSNTYGSSIKPTVFIYSILSFFVLYYLSDILTKYTSSKLQTWLSSQSFFLFLSHILVMELLKSYLYIIDVRIDSLIFKGIVITILSLTGACILQYIPCAEYLGVKRKYYEKMNENYYEKSTVN